LNRKEITDVIVDGEKLFLKAKKEIEIRCGKSALILKADGKVVIKGEQIISRARKVNKIKGAAVKIN
jgi:archaeosine-15-forming tRNA-guanine transglycosylase